MQSHLIPYLQPFFSGAFLLSTKGAAINRSLGQRPGKIRLPRSSAEGAAQRTGTNRAFRAGVGVKLIPGALPQARRGESVRRRTKMNSAPLALSAVLI
jgi:hypothetical protein